ncbi:hypothetical protein [Pedobacter faecalis]|uniref:hypothetical protein n=1 Tax=Pedobacter faecalis TaxID=3041495 RepID=UPI00254EE21D|nr:hypothetical protein [Pedobacter sp. ELA7]
MIKHLPSKVFALAALFVLSITGCKKNKSEEPETIQLEASTNSYYPYEVVQIALQEVSIQQKEVSSTINGKLVKIVIIDNFAHFIVPDLPAGEYNVGFVADRPFELSISISHAPSIKTAEEYHEKYLTGFNNILNSFEQSTQNNATSDEDKAALAADRQRFKTLFDEYEAAYNKLSPEEKLAFARTMASNYQWIDQLAKVTQSISKNPLDIQPKMVTTSDVDLYDYETEQNYALTQWLNSSRILRNNIAKLAATIMLVPVTSAIPVIGTIGTGIALGYLATEVMASLSVNLADMRTLLNTSFAPYDNLLAETEQEYPHGEQRVISIQGRFRSLISSDQSGNEISGALRAFLTSVIELRSEVTNILNKVPDRFKPSVLLASLKTNANILTRQISGAYLSISNVTNPKVNIDFSKSADGNFQITPTVSGTSDERVSFDITYSNPNFSNKQIRKTITTTVKYQIDSTHIYAKLVLGNWTVTNLEDNTSYDMVVHEDGKATYYTSSGSEFQSTWTIQKRGAKYYFGEAGFWHPGFNQFRTYNQGFHDEGLRIPLKSFVHYQGTLASLRYEKK